MNKWFNDDFADGLNLPWEAMVVRLGVALVCGLIVAATYYASKQRNLDQSAPLSTTLVLLTVLVAMTAIVIGGSVARAFSLVGALTIVRFRTAVDDARDTAFVIFAVVTGMAIGAGQLMVTVVGLPIVSLAAVVLHWLESGMKKSPSEQRLELRIGGEHDPAELLAVVFEGQLLNYRLQQIVTARQGAALDLRYVVRLRNPDNALPFVRALQQVEGVQSVELKETT